MNEWMEAVEAKARIIHAQLAAARAIAQRNGASADAVSRPYLELLRSLYREEFAFAQLVDTSPPAGATRRPGRQEPDHA